MEPEKFGHKKSQKVTKTRTDQTAHETLEMYETTFGVWTRISRMNTDEKLN
jgi:hypothetical protein